MARNKGDDVTGHVMGSASPFMDVALNQPLGVVAFFVLFSALAVLVAIVRGLVETSGTWGPYALFALAGAILYAAHRWMWTPLAEDPRTPRRITFGIVVVAAIVLELCTGQAGLVIGRATGYNPEVALMNAGFPVGGNIRSAIKQQDERDANGADCKARLAAGNMFHGRSGSVYLSQLCSGYIPLTEQKKACGLLEAAKANGVTYDNEKYCRSIGVWLTNRNGVF